MFSLQHVNCIMDITHNYLFVPCNIHSYMNVYISKIKNYNVYIFFSKYNYTDIRMSCFPTARKVALYYPRSEDGIGDSEHLQVKNVIEGFLLTSSTHGINFMHSEKGLYLGDFCLKLIRQQVTSVNNLYIMYHNLNSTLVDNIIFCKVFISF